MMSYFSSWPAQRSPVTYQEVPRWACLLGASSKRASQCTWTSWLSSWEPCSALVRRNGNFKWHLSQYKLNIIEISFEERRTETENNLAGVTQKQISVCQCETRIYPILIKFVFCLNQSQKSHYMPDRLGFYWFTVWFLALSIVLGHLHDKFNLWCTTGFNRRSFFFCACAFTLPYNKKISCISTLYSLKYLLILCFLYWLISGPDSIKASPTLFC